nr:lipid II flippase MurJ [Angustibacter aerolatus]
MPQITRAAKHADGGRAFLDRLLTISLLGLAAVTVVATLASPLVPVLLQPGGGRPWDPATQHLAVAFAYWCVPQVFFYGLYTVLGQVLNARGRFGAYMWAPVVNNVVAIAGLAVLLHQPGQARGRAARTPSTAWDGGRVAVLAGTATLGVAVQALVLLWPLHRMGFRYRPRFGLRGVGLGGAGRVAAWTFAAALVSQARLPGDGEGRERRWLRRRPRPERLRPGVPAVHAAALAGHGVAGHRALHPHEPVGGGRRHVRRPPRPVGGAAADRRRHGARLRRRRRARARPDRHDLLPQRPLRDRRHRRDHHRDDGRAGAVQRAVPVPAGVLRARGRPHPVPRALPVVAIIAVTRLRVGPHARPAAGGGRHRARHGAGLHGRRGAVGRAAAPAAALARRRPRAAHLRAAGGRRRARRRAGVGVSRLVHAALDGFAAAALSLAVGGAVLLVVYVGLCRVMHVGEARRGGRAGAAPAARAPLTDWSERATAPAGARARHRWVSVSTRPATRPAAPVRDAGDVLVGWLVRLAVVFGLVGAVGFDAAGVIGTKVDLSDRASLRRQHRERRPGRDPRRPAGAARGAAVGRGRRRRHPARPGPVLDRRRRHGDRDAAAHRPHLRRRPRAAAAAPGPPQRHRDLPGDAVSTGRRRAGLSLLAAAVTAAGVLIAPASASADPDLSTLKARATALRAELDRLGVQQGLAVEQYDEARERLQQATIGEVVAATGLDDAGQAARVRDDAAADRVRAIYMSGGPVGLSGALLQSRLDLRRAQPLAGARGGRPGRRRGRRPGERRDRRPEGAGARRRPRPRAAGRRQGRGRRRGRARADAARPPAGACSPTPTPRSSRSPTSSAGRPRPRRSPGLPRAPPPPASPSARPASAARPTRRGTASRAARPAGSAPAVAAPNAVAAAAISAAATRLGMPYVWGATGPTSFDCSGLMQWAYRQAGVSIPRTSRAQYAALPKVPMNQVQPGDLVFYASNPSNPSTIHHVGMYVGEGLSLYAPQTGSNVKIGPVAYGTIIGAARPTATR